MTDVGKLLPPACSVWTPGELVSNEQTPLHIVVFKKDDELSRQHTAGFGAVVEVAAVYGL